MSEIPATDMTLGVYRRIYSNATTGRRINRVCPMSELIFWRLHMIADDFGNFQADPDLVKAKAFPIHPGVRAPEIAAALEELSAPAHNLILLYAVAGEPYGHIQEFEMRQPAGKNGKRIKRYPGESRCIQVNPGVSGESSAPRREEDHSETETITTPTSSASPEDIYQAYPRKLGKGDALKAIQKALGTIRRRNGCPADPPGWLLARVAAFAASPAGNAGSFTPHPATWFNRGSFDDDPKEWERKDDNGKSNGRDKSGQRPGEYRETLTLDGI